MKKVISVFLAVILVISLTACGAGNEKPESTNYFNDAGDFIIEDVGRYTVMTESLPRSVNYNGKNITLTDVSFYENCVDYSYMLFIVATLDVSELSESEIHWLRESDISVHCYITSEANDYDFDRATALGDLLLTDKNELIYVQISSVLEENRHSFASSDVSVCITVEQEETYEYTRSDGDIGTLNKEECLTYEATTGQSIQDAESISHPLYDYVAEWLYDQARWYASH